jgi:hypothetical protein
MISRRTFLAGIGAGLAGAPLVGLADSPSSRRKRLSIITTEWRFRSHAWHMGERFLVGYPIQGRWHQPPLDVVSVYVDQTPANDLSKERAQEFGFKLCPTIADALRLGGEKLAVDAVLIIGEHGDYPTNKIGQKQYPRYEFFKQVTMVRLGHPDMASPHGPSDAHDDSVCKTHQRRTYSREAASVAAITTTPPRGRVGSVRWCS